MGKIPKPKKPAGGLIGRTVNRAISDAQREQTAERERKEAEAAAATRRQTRGNHS